MFRGKRASQLCLSGTKGRIKRHFSQVGKSAVFPVQEFLVWEKQQHLTPVTTRSMGKLSLLPVLFSSCGKTVFSFPNLGKVPSIGDTHEPAELSLPPKKCQLPPTALGFLVLPAEKKKDESGSAFFIIFVEPMTKFRLLRC